MVVPRYTVVHCSIERQNRRTPMSPWPYNLDSLLFYNSGTVPVDLFLWCGHLPSVYRPSIKRVSSESVKRIITECAHKLTIHHISRPLRFSSIKSLVNLMIFRNTCNYTIWTTLLRKRIAQLQKHRQNPSTKFVDILGGCISKENRQVFNFLNIFFCNYNAGEN